MIEIIKNWYGLILFYLFRIFPLQDKIVFSSFYGENYEGNPKYISDYLLEKRKERLSLQKNHRILAWHHLERLCRYQLRSSS